MARNQIARSARRLLKQARGFQTAGPNSAPSHAGKSSGITGTSAGSRAGADARRSAPVVSRQGVRELAAPSQQAVKQAQVEVDVMPEVEGAAVFQNVDGKRIEDGRYKDFIGQIGPFIPEQRIIQDPVRTFAYGTDASFYRLTPKMVVKVHDEVSTVTFRGMHDHRCAVGHTQSHIFCCPASHCNLL